VSTPRLLFFLCPLACAALLNAQTPPTAYVITQSVGTAGGTSTTYRSGSKVLVDFNQPAQAGTPAARSLSFYDLTAGTNTTWNPDASPVQCSVGTFSGDWGDPFAGTAELEGDIAKGDLKPAGSATINGIATQIYAGTTQGANVKAWIDTKDYGLVIRVEVTSPGADLMVVSDVTKVSFATPAPSVFALPAACAGLKPPPTPAQLIADETGDDPANYVSNAGPGSKNGCSVVLRVVSAKTMTPITHIQVVIDTAAFSDSAPPSYTMGVADDGTTTYSGGHVMEITNRVHNGVVRLGLPPDHFMLGVNVPLPHHGGSIGLVYRQCFAPTTVLLDVVKDYGQDDQSQDLLWVKAGKYAAPPPQ
jgi:hypothetical protein